MQTIRNIHDEKTANTLKDHNRTYITCLHRISLPAFMFIEYRIKKTRNERQIEGKAKWTTNKLCVRVLV